VKKLLILSGKGGTGKTTITDAFIKLSKAKVFADCDVDAPNLHLTIKPNSQPKRRDFCGMGKAKIIEEKCVYCGRCIENCRFDAIKFDNKKYCVDVFSCEGCSVCEMICPVNAIHIKPDIAGELELYSDEVLFSTAKLKMGSGTSGKLVTEVKKPINTASIEADFAIIDGSPGIGCPVIASLSGVDMVLVVAEPSLSGISDMERIILTADNFKVKTAVCVNKYDVNKENSAKVEEICINKKLDFVGRIPYDKQIVSALNEGRNVLDLNCIVVEEIKSVYENTMSILFE
jgi:MinD superfamily P-loop ATPase